MAAAAAAMLGPGFQGGAEPRSGSPGQAGPGSKQQAGSGSSGPPLTRLAAHEGQLVHAVGIHPGPRHIGRLRVVAAAAQLERHQQVVGLGEAAAVGQIERSPVEVGVGRQHRVHCIAAGVGRRRRRGHDEGDVGHSGVHPVKVGPAEGRGLQAHPVDLVQSEAGQQVAVGDVVSLHLRASQQQAGFVAVRQASEHCSGACSPPVPY